MILVHDDDLARIQGNLQPDALMGHLRSAKPEIAQVLYGQYTINITTSPVFTAMTFPQLRRLPICE
jgi:hypothetical protein